MTPVIDLRRFARAGERAVLVRLDGRQVRASFGHVSTEWATVEVPHAMVAVSDNVRTALYDANYSCTVAGRASRLSDDSAFMRTISFASSSASADAMRCRRCARAAARPT